MLIYCTCDSKGSLNLCFEISCTSYIMPKHLPDFSYKEFTTSLSQTNPVFQTWEFFFPLQQNISNRNNETQLNIHYISKSILTGVILPKYFCKAVSTHTQKPFKTFHNIFGIIHRIKMTGQSLKAKMHCVFNKYSSEHIFRSYTLKITIWDLICIFACQIYS